MTRVLLSLGPDDTGLAIAHALHEAVPDVSLTGLSRAPHGPAVHAEVFDDVWTLPSWTNLDPEAHAKDLASRLGPDTWYLPSSSPEAHWLADRFATEPTVLAPSPQSLTQTTGPEPDALSGLSCSVPDWRSLAAPVEQLHAFGRRYNWALWMRGPLGHRRSLDHWTEFAATRDEMLDRVDDHRTLTLQRQVDGVPLIISFAAVQGSLLDAALVRPHTDRRDTSPVAPLPNGLRSSLAAALESVGWTGGGTLVLIEDSDGTRWFDSWRPCFGEEIKAVTPYGKNIPARLIAARSDLSAPKDILAADTISETTATRSVATPFLIVKTPSDDEADSSPPLPQSTLPSGPAPPNELSTELRSIIDDLPSDWMTGDTPRSVLLPTRMEPRFEAFVNAANRIEDAFSLDTARVGLSIKTNPAAPLLATARTTGMLAETIHPDELDHARRHGYHIDEIIVNGPVQALLPTLDTAPYALFGDAVKDLDDLPFDPTGAIIGVRTRPPERGPSRFGVDLSDSERMHRLCERLTALPKRTRIGLHLHAPSSTLGHNRWWDSVQRVLSWAKTIREWTGRPVECLDLGGGWHPDDWLEVFVPGLLERRASIRSALPELNTLLLEPGKALSQPLGVVVSRVLDARPTRNEVILDASIAELSNIDYHPHRLLAHTEARGWHRLPSGEGRLLGRLCMEADILGRHRQVNHLSPGDTVVVCDAGAYDASMTYPFGQGCSAAT